MDDASALNAEQQRAVDTWDRPVLVMAPVGTGKTRVLALRAARAAAGGVEPSSILCLSFTNKAAREMRARLSAKLGKAAGMLATHTFHGLCATILRQEAGSLGLDSDFLIYDEEDSTEIWTRLLPRHGLEFDRGGAERAAYLFHMAGQQARLSRYDDAQVRKPQAVFEQAAARAAFPLSRRVAFAELLAAYVHTLRENHAVDFADLILGVNRLWDENPAALDRWRRRFAWMQVDEVQDTSRAEYRVLRMMAASHRQLSFFGDIDQTIYEWRGSAPFEIVKEYRREFQPEVIPLVRNYRSTQAILAACAEVIRNCPDSVTEQILAQQADPGEPVRVVDAASPQAEAEWIAGRIRQLHAQHHLAWRDCAVLVRTNFTARDISAIFARENIPHVQVEQQRFFQRAEIKAALAHLRLLEGRHDANSLLRCLRTPPKGIGEATLERLSGQAREAGLRLGDLLEESTLESGDPFLPLLEAWRDNRVVVFDTETTGLDIAADEIVEIAAVRCGASGIGDRFHWFLRPTIPVGDSALIHGWTDEFLARKGCDPAEVLEQFQQFAEDCALAGHNVLAFDVPILAANLRRYGRAPLPPGPVFDTLDITRRFHRLPRYRLADIARALELDATPTHQAMDDVEATAALLGKLMGPLERGAALRHAAVRKEGRRFLTLARQFSSWREMRLTLRPAALLHQVLEDAGFLRHYENEDDGPKRIEHLQELERLFRRTDNPALPPREALLQALNFAALGSDVDRQASDEDRVLILTVHQSKGLEFDTVFVAHATDNDFPSLRSQREGRQVEENRLFYVALSRARRRLFISWPRVNSYGRRQLLTRYVPKSWLGPH